MCEESLQPSEVQIVDVTSFLQKNGWPSEEIIQEDGARPVAEDAPAKLKVVDNSVKSDEAKASAAC